MLLTEEVPCGVLPALEEPRGARRRLMALALRDPAAARRLVVSEVTDHALFRWAETLGDAGLAPQAVSEAVASAARELWLWVMGDRIWPQLSANLAGRAVRRRGASPPSP